MDVVGPKARATYTGAYGLTIQADLAPQDVRIDDYVAIIIPGGRAPDRMRTNKGLENLAREASCKGKVVATICHGPQLIIEAGVVKGKKATCYVSVPTDLRNAGAVYLDKPVAVDRTLVTSRVPAELPAFCREALNLLQK